MKLPKIKNWFSFGQVNATEVKAPADSEKHLSQTVIPIRLARIKQDMLTWRTAIDEAERPFNPFRVQLQQLYIDTIIDGHVKACMDRRKDLTTLRDWQIVNSKGEPNEEVAKLLNKTWFNRFLIHSLDALFYGYSLIELGDITDNQFKDIKVTKRWNVSPDRYVVANMAYNLNGVPFRDEPWADWHVYVSTTNDIGTSDCGYGMLYEVGLYQIFLRNLLGFNGDFLELFGQPIRVGKTNKIEESERGEFAQALSEMGSAGWILLDAIDDQIELIESGNVGSSWQAYANFETRLQKIISKIILGHADAMDSVPGKLGAQQGEDSPVDKALNAKQAKDGFFMADVVNTELLPRLKKLGFPIPEDCIFEFKNDHEIHENNNKTADLAVKIKQAGLQMDPAYFEEQTGIKLSEVAAPQAPGLTPSVKDKLKNLYR